MKLKEAVRQTILSCYQYQNYKDFVLVEIVDQKNQEILENQK